jgi:hypothetical protein
MPFASIVLCVTGVLLLGAGRTVMPVTVFAAAFVTMGYFAFQAWLVTGTTLQLSTEVLAYGSVILGVLAGTLAGLAALRAVLLGLFAIGAGTGAAIALFVMAMMQLRELPPHTPTVVIVTGAIIGGIFAIWMKGQILAVTSSVLGAFALLQGLATGAWIPILDELPTASELLALERAGVHADGQQPAASTSFWIEVTLFLTLSVFGSWFQLREPERASFFFESGRGGGRRGRRGGDGWGNYRELRDDSTYE